MSQDTLTRKDIDDVLGVLDVMMTRIDERFTGAESTLTVTQKQMRRILTRLDHIDKQVEISEDERLVMAHQLTRLHEWVEKAAAHINVSFTHSQQKQRRSHSLPMQRLIQLPGQRTPSEEQPSQPPN